jgi:hypothetical protein
MPVSKPQQKQKAGVSVPVVAAAIVVLILIVSVMAYKNFAPPPHAAGPIAESQNDWIAQAAKQAKGDFTKVDPALQQKLNIYTGGKGAELIKSKYESAIH